MREPSTAERLNVIASLCGALTEAHRRGAALGGLEPGNIDITGDTARLEPGSPGPGSPYAAPERGEGRPPDTKGDIYSAAAIFYEILTGKPPFASDPPRPLQETRPDLSQDLTDAISACMEQDPEWRPADLSYLLAVLQQLQKDSPAASKPPAPRPVATRASGPPTTLLDPTPRKRHDDRGSLTRVLPVLLVVVAMAGTGGAWLWYQFVRPGRPAMTSPPRGAPRSSDARAGTEPARSAAIAPPAPGGPVAQPTPAPSQAVAAPATVTTPRPSEPPASPLGPPRPSAAALQPSTLPAPTALPSPPPSTMAAPVPDRNLDTNDAAPPPGPEPTTPPAQTTAAPDQPPGPATIRAVAPFRLRAGALNVLDVHGSGLRADHRARIVPQRRREPSAGFSVTRYQLRNPGLLLVFVQVDPGVPQGKYSLSLVDAGGAETNPFTIEVGNK